MIFFIFTLECWGFAKGWFPLDAAFFAYSWKLPAYNGAFLLTDNNFSKFAYNWSFFVYNFGLFVYNWSLFAYNFSVLLTIGAFLFTVSAFLLTTFEFFYLLWESVSNKGLKGL